MNKCYASGRRLSWVGRVIAAAAVVLALAVPANAAAILDLTIGDSLGPLVVNYYASGNFSAVGTNVPLSWTDSLGNPGGTADGNAQILWNAGSSTGTLFVENLVPSTLLSGSLTSFMASVGSPASSFAGEVLLSVSNLGQGNYVHFVVNSTNLIADQNGNYSGTGLADVYPAAVPEPATLGLMSIGLGALAVRRRRARR